MFQTAMTETLAKTNGMWIAGGASDSMSGRRMGNSNRACGSISVLLQSGSIDRHNGGRVSLSGTCAALCSLYCLSAVTKSRSGSQSLFRKSLALLFPIHRRSRGVALDIESDQRYSQWPKRMCRSEGKAVGQNQSKESTTHPRHSGSTTYRGVEMEERVVECLDNDKMKRVR